MERETQEQDQTGRADGEMTLVEHLAELRKRLIRMLIALGAASIIGYVEIDRVMAYLVAPAGKLYYMSPAEAFFTYCKVALIVGFLIALPVICYQIWAFLKPALTRKERIAGLALVPGAVTLFYAGVVFAYVFALPMAIKFFLGFASDSLAPMLSLGGYVSFVLSFCLPFGLVFQLPIVMLALAATGSLKPEVLSGKRKYVIVFSFIAGAVISPTPDIFGQTLLALPIIALYEVSLVLIRLLIRK